LRIGFCASVEAYGFELRPQDSALTI
jgi:hypothetical protein